MCEGQILSTTGSEEVEIIVCAGNLDFVTSTASAHVTEHHTTQQIGR